MSSLAASKADNFYYPPEWRPEMGGISKFQGSKGANQYEQYGIIRFELPFDAWCLGCNCHMSKGLRFNAKKDKAGKYFSTTIWAFDMKCYSCEQRFIIKTDPKNQTYEFAEGLRKHEQDYDPEEGDGQVIVTLSDEARANLQKDAMFRLEHEQEDIAKAKATQKRIEKIQEKREDNARRDYDANALLRNQNRAKRKRDQAMLEEGKAKGFSFPLLPSSIEDELAAKEVSFRRQRIDHHREAELQQRSLMAAQSILPAKDPASKPKISIQAFKLAGKLGLQNQIQTQSRTDTSITVNIKPKKGGQATKTTK